MINLLASPADILVYVPQFYRGPAPSLWDIISPDPSSVPVKNDETFDQAHYCAQLRKELVSEKAAASLGSESYDEVVQLYTHNCDSLHLLDAVHYKSINSSQDKIIAEAKDAALYFLMAAHLDGEAILEQYDEYRSKVQSSFETHLHEKLFPIELLSNLPTTKSPVKAIPTYVQTPCKNSCVEGQSSVLNFVWKLEVEMQDNWYEAYVDAFSPTRIVKVVDWVSDAGPKCTTSESRYGPIPKKPKQDENGITESWYRIWPWGVNDPTEGKRDVVKNPYDVTASPIGWHSIPKVNNPGEDLFLVGKNELCNFTTTWGNNVHAQENWAGKDSWMDNYRPEANDNLTFDFKFGAESPKHDGDWIDPKSYVNLSITQLF